MKTRTTKGPSIHHLSMLDHFAGLAMQGIVSSIDSEESYDRIHEHAVNQGLKVSSWIARDAYKQAEAMLKERKEYLILTDEEYDNIQRTLDEDEKKIP